MEHGWKEQDRWYNRGNVRSVKMSDIGALGTLVMRQ